MSLDQVVWRDPQTGLHFLPGAADNSAAHPGRVLAPERAERLLAALRAGYERVVIDLPAISGTADAGVLAELLDGLLLVANWGGMDGKTMAEVLDGLGNGRDKLLGVALNRVKLRQLRNYGVAVDVPTRGRGTDTYSGSPLDWYKTAR
jgi:polysaccharide biosynthesis transport protein